MEKYFIYKTKHGDIKIIYSAKGVTRIILPYEKNNDLSLLEYAENKRIKEFFEDYFGGKEPEKLDLDINITDFQRRVFEILRDTRMGTILTYGDIARLMNCGSSQAIGQALKRNPLPIVIACHRVIGKGWDGGFAGETTGEKMDFKKVLIEHERDCVK